MSCKAMLCSSFWFHWKLIYSSTGTRQAKRASRFKWAHKKLRDLFCTNWGKLPGPHFLPVSSWPAGAWHKIIEFDSTLALLWERRSALEQQVYGVKLCAYTITTPTTQILYLVSIGRRHVPLHLLVCWPWLLTVSCFAARFCFCKSLVVSVEGHHQTCLPLQESLTTRCIVMT